MEKVVSIPDVAFSRERMVIAINDVLKDLKAIRESLWHFSCVGLKAEWQYQYLESAEIRLWGCLRDLGVDE